MIRGVCRRKVPSGGAQVKSKCRCRDSQRHNNVVLLEFKRPGKENFGKNNPYDQVLLYIEKLKLNDQVFCS